MELVNSLLNADKFTKLEIRNTYGNLRVPIGNKDKLAVVCQAGQFAPPTMQFGTTGEPSYFQYFIHDTLCVRIGKDQAKYLENTMAYTEKGFNHKQSVIKILVILSKYDLWLKPEK